MEGASNGGLLYHEVQESKLCAVHCVNTVLQGPFFSEFDLAALASDLDHRERQMMRQAGGDYLPDQSHNVSLDGDFSIQVLERALEVWDLQIIPLDSPVAEPAQIDPELENAFICHLQDHWFCIRKVNGEWYNFNSLYAAPEHLSKFYLSAYLGSLKGSGWSIFLVRGNFPKESLIASSEGSNGYGRWLSPEEAERILKSTNLRQRAPAGTGEAQELSDPYLQYGEELLLDEEDEDLKAAIAASLLDSSSASVKTETLPDSSSASVKTETLPDSSSATVKKETLLDSSSATVKRETFPDSSSASVKTETFPDSSLASVKTETLPDSLSATVKKETLLDSSSATVKTETGVSEEEKKQENKPNTQQNVLQ